MAATADPGDDRIYIQDPINWEVGQQVVLTTTWFQDLTWNWNHNEVMTIKAIEKNMIQFTEPLEYPHFAIKEYQGEVALLSRRIILQGDESSEITGFGGHVMVMGTGRFSGVQGYRMGQTNVLARYIRKALQ